MPSHLKLIVNNSPETLAANRRRAADQIVGTRPNETAAQPATYSRGMGPTLADSLPGSINGLLSGISHLALTVAALAGAAPTAAAQSASDVSEAATASAPSASSAPPSDAAVPPLDTAPAAPAAAGTSAQDTSAADTSASSDEAGSSAVLGVEGSGQTSGGTSGDGGSASEGPSRAGSSTSLSILKGSGVAATPEGISSLDPTTSGFYSLEAAPSIETTPTADSTRGPVSEGNTADFSQAASFSPVREIKIKKSVETGEGKSADGEGHDTIKQISRGNGVYVDLSKSSGDELDAAQLDADGRAATKIGGLAPADNVIGTIGNDIVIGNDHANTYIYTADDDATADASGVLAPGQNASYGFDIYSGGRAATGDTEDTLDFSRLGGSDGELLPFAAKGIVVDLEQSLTIETIDPLSGAPIDITGSLVSTTGGGDSIDLALIVWAERSELSGGPGASPAEASAIETALGMRASIENIVGTGGADVVLGNGEANTYTVTSDGSEGASTFDGRGGQDTIDLSHAHLSDGIEIHLTGSAEDGSASVVTASGGIEIALVRNVENVIGTRHDDTFEGDARDNTFTGGGGCDTYLFTAAHGDDGRIVLSIGYDLIRDFSFGYAASGGADRIIFDNLMFGFTGGMSSSDKIGYVLDHYARDADVGLVIRFDDSNALTLERVFLGDVRDGGEGSRTWKHGFADSIDFV